jgi:glutamate racemase
MPAKTRRENKNLKIGIIDSGIGGLTVLHQAMRLLPNEDYLFYADTDHVPYGEKTKEEIICYTDGAVRFLLEKGAKAIVVACNTATSVAIDELRRRYDIPLLGIEPAVKPAVEECDGRRILVIATPVTVREEKLKNLIARVDESHLVDLLAMPKLVHFAEAGEFRSPEVTAYLRSRFTGCDLEQYSSLVLGCTHFNYFKDTLSEIFPQTVDFLDGSEGTARHLAEVLRENGLAGSGTGSVEYYRSGRQITDAADLARIRLLLERLEKMRRIRTGAAPASTSVAKII